MCENFEKTVNSLHAKEKYDFDRDFGILFANPVQIKIHTECLYFRGFIR